MDEFQRTGFAVAGTGASLSTVAAILDRVENKIGELLALSQHRVAGLAAAPTALSRQIPDPLEALMASLATGDTRRGREIFRSYHAELKVNDRLLFASQLAGRGDELAASIIQTALAKDFKTLLEQEPEVVHRCVAGLARYYRSANQPEEAARLVLPYITAALEACHDDEGRAFLLNQRHMLLYAAEQYQEGLNDVLEAMRLAPTETAYVYNASLAYEKLGTLDRAEAMIDLLMRLGGDDDDDHLQHAVEIYIQRGRIKQAREAYARLQTINPDRAALMSLDKGLRAALA
jgi:tetratricopeptide (TPR) repeat protein